MSQNVISRWEELESFQTLLLKRAYILIAVLKGDLTTKQSILIVDAYIGAIGEVFQKQTAKL